MKKFNVLDCLAAIQNKDSYTFGHSVRVAYFAEKLAVAAGLSVEVTAAIKEAALCHDIGKIFTPDAILNKPGKLTNEEFKVMTLHTTQGVDYLMENFSEVPEMVINVVLGHHYNSGAGYPAAAAMVDGSIAQRIVTVCDIFDGICSNRVYRQSLVPVEEGIAIMEKDAKVDESLLKVFVEKVIPEISIDWEATSLQVGCCIN